MSRTHIQVNTVAKNQTESPCTASAAQTDGNASLHKPFGLLYHSIGAEHRYHARSATPARDGSRGRLERACGSSHNPRHIQMTGNLNYNALDRLGAEGMRTAHAQIPQSDGKNQSGVSCQRRAQWRRVFWRHRLYGWQGEVHMTMRGERWGVGARERWGRGGRKVNECVGEWRGREGETWRWREGSPAQKEHCTQKYRNERCRFLPSSAIPSFHEPHSVAKSKKRDSGPRAPRRQWRLRVPR